MYEIVLGRSKQAREKYGLQGTIYLGKQYIQMGQSTSLANDIYMDVSQPHIILIPGKRGSGKSYSIGVIAEGLVALEDEVSSNLACLIFDTMGIYWTMRFANYKDDELLSKWKLKPKKLSPVVFVPKGLAKEYEQKGVQFEEEFSIRPEDISTDAWGNIFNIDLNTEEGLLLERTIHELSSNFSIKDIITKIMADKAASDHSKSLLTSRFESAELWGLFDVKGTELTKLFTGGQTSVLDISAYAQLDRGTEIKAMIVGLICDKVLKTRLLARKEEEAKIVEEGGNVSGGEIYAGEKSPMIWILIDECLPADSTLVTNKGHTKIIDVVKRYGTGEQFKVLSYNEKTKSYEYNSVTKVYKNPQRAVVELTTETGRSLCCTPDHKILTKDGFVEAKYAKELARLLVHDYDGSKKLICARLLGAIFGDGYLNSTGTIVGFSGKGVDSDLLRIKTDLSSLGFSSGKIYSRKTNSQIKHVNGKVAQVKGVSQELRTSTKAYRFFKELGAPIGKKTESNTQIPDWLLNASVEEKAEFLAALMGADGMAPSQSNHIKSDFNAIRISFNKLESLEKQAGDYASQLKKLFEDVGVSISKVWKREGNIRKDGKKTIKIVLTLAKNVDNTVRFLDKVGYRYCGTKEVQGNKWLAYLQARQKLTFKRRTLREEAIRIHKEEGAGKCTIAKRLGLPIAHVRNWIYFGNNAWLPKNLPSFYDWISERTDGQTIYENIENKKELPLTDLYDISVENTHNFVANGYVVHNCHEFLPANKTTLASAPIIQILREGRQPGISLVLATQQPGSVAVDALTQADIVLSHRLTAKVDITALGDIMQTYLPHALRTYIRQLPGTKGCAVVLDDKLERIYPIQIRPRFSWHGGAEPTALTKRAIKLAEVKPEDSELLE